MSQDAREIYDQVAAELAASSPTTLGKMFGMPCLKIGAKTYAGFHNDSMVFKLSGAAHAGALALSGAHLFDPGMGRPMKEWVVVPSEHAERWPEIGRQALAYVGGV